MRRTACHLAAAALAAVCIAPHPALAQDVSQDRDRQIQQAIAGAALLGLFGLALSEHRKDEENDDDKARDRHHDADARWDRQDDAWPADRRDHHAWGPPGQRPGWVPPGHRRDWTPPGHRSDRTPPGHRWEREEDRAALPLSCIRQHDTQRGAVRLFDGGCLDRQAERTLPFECAAVIDAFGRLVSGYDPRCLRREGYGFADR